MPWPFPSITISSCGRPSPVRSRYRSASARSNRIAGSHRSAPAIQASALKVQAMSSIPQTDNERAEIDRLVAELEKAEAYEIRLRQFFVDIKAELAAGHTANAMSMLNEALRFIDDATDVVAPHQEP